MKEDIDGYRIIVRDFNIQLLRLYRLCRQKLNKEIIALNEFMENIGLIDVIKVTYLQKLTAHFSLVNMGHSLVLITNWIKKTYLGAGEIVWR